MGFCSLLIIGALHPLVIKVEDHIGKQAWQVFLLPGAVCAVCNVASLLICRQVLSMLMAVPGFSLFWSIRELFRQEKRMLWGWFPANPAKQTTIKPGGST